MSFPPPASPQFDPGFDRERLEAWAYAPVLPPRPSWWQRWGRHVVLLALTAASVTLAQGAWFSVSLLSILFAHEMGHYLACRYYRVDATLPFFIPSPWIPAGEMLWVPLSFVGTFGAVIRIRGPIPHRKALFDIGIAGPLAGFVVCLPVLWLALGEMRIAPLGPGDGLFLGDPLLLKWAARLTLGAIPDDLTYVIGPLGLAAWFGLFVTGLNLIPIGQLDGGHVMYALFRERAWLVSRVGWWVCVALAYFSPTWVIWAVLLRVLGRQHPRTVDDDESIGSGRALVGLVGLVVFVLCFVPDPVQGSWQTIGELLRSLLTSR